MLRNKKRGKIQLAQSSIVLDVATILNKKNIKNHYTYLYKLGISSTTAQKMLSGKLAQVNLNHITLLCTHLNCTPNELFANKNIDIPTGHALEKLRKIDETEHATIQDWLATKTIEEIEELMRK